MYRDEYERCPRCHAELVDAGSTRACNACSGLWVTEQVLREMAADMRIPPSPVTLKFAYVKRTPIACPSCSEAMATTVLNRVELDRCENHGVWFDRGELAAVLIAYAPSAFDDA